MCDFPMGPINRLPRGNRLHSVLPVAYGSRQWVQCDLPCRITPCMSLSLAGGGADALMNLGLSGEFRPNLVLEGLVIRALVALEA